MASKGKPVSTDMKLQALAEVDKEVTGMCVLCSTLATYVGASTWKLPQATYTSGTQNSDIDAVLLM